MEQILMINNALFITVDNRMNFDNNYFVTVLTLTINNIYQ